VAQEENTPARWPVSVTIPTISPASSRRSEPIRFSAIVCAAIFVRVVRRLSTVPSRHGLVDFEERMVIKKVREVERSERSAAWFKFDSPLCSQRAKGTASASVAG
jgi:hypothetical protein